MTLPHLRTRGVALGWGSVAIVALCLNLLAVPRSACGADVIFTIDPSLSSLTESGIDNTHGVFQPQSSGGLTSPISGHFLVTFDPTTNSPTTVQFDGGHGYFVLATNTQGLPGAPPGLSMTTPEPANLAGTTVGGDAIFAVRNLSWDFHSAPLSISGPTFSATSTYFTVLSEKLSYKDGPSATSVDETGVSNHLSTGSWTLQQSAPGSGDWSLSLNATYSFGYNLASSGTLTDTVKVVSTAHFGTENSAIVPNTGAPVEVQVLGGAGATGGVTAAFSDTATAGTLSVQQIPNDTSLSQAAVDAAAANHAFAVSTQALSVAPQIWDVHYDGNLNGGNATLVFNYDPALLPAGTDQSALGVWHYSALRDKWEFGGTVDTLNHTITYVTDGFSPFELGVNAPEPSTAVLAAFAMVPWAYRAWRRKRAQVR